MAEKTIKIKVDKSGAQRALDQVNKALGKVGLKADISKSSVDGANTSMGKMIPIMSNVAIGLGAVGAAAVAGSTALVAFTRTNTLAIKEMEKSARLAGINAQAFQAYAYAANSVGVSQEKFSDILKDVNDRVGEFIAEGGGEFQFIFEELLEPIGITTEALKEMSSTEVLGAVQKGLDAVNADAKLTTTTYERLANDATLLQPLLEDNARGMNDLAREARDMGLIISQDQIDKANEFNRSFELLDKQVEIFGQSISAELSPAMKELVELSGVLLSSLSQTFNLGIDAKIATKQEEISELETAIFERIKSGAKSFGDVSIFDALNPFSEDTGDTDAMTASLEKLRKELDLLEEQKKKISESVGAEDKPNDDSDSGDDSQDKLIAYLKGEIERLKNESISTDEDKSAEDRLKRRKDYLDKWVDQTQQYNLTDQELNEEWKKAELAKLEEWYALNLDKKEEYEKAFYDIGNKYLSNSRKLKETEDSKRVDSEKETQRDMVAAVSAGQQALDSLAAAAEGRSDALNALVKGAAVFQASANLAVAYTQAFSDPTAVGVPQKFANYALLVSAGANLMSSLTNLQPPSRQTGGYMMGDTPYQVGGGAHTGDPEMYQSGGKSYLIDSQAGMMTRVTGNSGGQSGQGGGVAVSINNYGQESTASVTDGGIDENGVRQMIIEMTPNIMAKEVNNASSPYRSAMSVNSKTQWDYS